MPLPVFPPDLVTALDGLDDEHTVFLDPRTGQVERLSSEDEGLLQLVVDDDTPGWQAERAALVQDVLRGHRWLQLPSSFDLDEWALMERFVLSLGDGVARQKLRVEIRREGAYARFHGAIAQFGLGAAWQDYHGLGLAEVAVAWLEKNRVPYTLETDG